jgi:hypothetical protein
MGMGYRDDGLALHLRVNALDRELEQERSRAEAAERARAEMLETLERLRDGVAEDDDLDEIGLLRWRRALLALTGVGIVGSVVGAILFATAYFPEPHLTWQGLRNAAWIVRHGVGATGLLGAVAILALGTPWFVLPWVGSRGLLRRRRWGWLTSVVACVLWLPTPLIFVSVYSLSRLFSASTMRVFFHR